MSAGSGERGGRERAASSELEADVELERAEPATTLISEPNATEPPATGPRTVQSPVARGAVAIAPNAAPIPAGLPSPGAVMSTESALGFTAVMPAVGFECASCGKANHPGVTHCVFCGAPVSPSMRGVAASGWSETPEEGRSAMARLDTDPPASRAAEVDSDPEIAAPIADPLIGVIVAERYRIVDLLGRGGMGIVYKVEHIRIGKLLAMKLLTGELSRNPDVVRRFKQEALTVSKLSSPNTVQVFDYGASDGLTYLVMELVAGEDLGRALRTLGPMPFSRLGKIVVQVCSSLAEAHQKGIVHRDIKPENIMLLRGREGADVTKVLDFGLAKLRESEALNDVTSQGAIVGTPYFMAPEQIRGEAVDARTDIYALGALMYRVLTGHYPFGGTTPMAVFTKHLADDPVPPSERAPDLGIPPRVSQLVLKALRKNPDERFQRVEDLQALLVQELQSLGTSSVENLLDSGQVRRLARMGPGLEASAVVPGVELATRDEVEAYERKLRRQRYGAGVSAVAIAIFSALVAAKFVVSQKTEFSGTEIEPNNTAGEATKVPLGQRATGMLGKRIDAAHSDRDFYAFDVPARSGSKPVYVALHVSALPNIPMCTMLYRQGLSTALGQYCVGRPGRELAIPALRVEPGRYLIGVMQDLESYGKAPRFVHENVSDAYALLVEATEPDPAAETEPNDTVSSAEILVPAGRASVTAAIGWANDEDVYCVPAGTPGKVRWKVRDGLRDTGVLEVTPMRGTEADAAVRLHLGSSSMSTKGKVSASDALSPWASGPIVAEDGIARCLRVKLAGDPWSEEQAGVVPSGGSEPYVVEIEAVP